MRLCRREILCMWWIIKRFLSGVNSIPISDSINVMFVGMTHCMYVCLVVIIRFFSWLITFSTKLRDLNLHGQECVYAGEKSYVCGKSSKGFSPEWTQSHFWESCLWKFIVRLSIRSEEVFLRVDYFFNFYRAACHEPSGAGMRLRRREEKYLLQAQCLWHVV